MFGGAHYPNRRYREDENERVFAWRMGTLLQAGYDISAAERLAGAPVDLHAAYELVTVRGCPPALAARVLL